MGFNSDIWSLGIVLIEFFISVEMLEDGGDLIQSLNLRDITYEARVKFVEKRIRDPAFRQLAILMLCD